MPLLVNLRHLEVHPLVLDGELPVDQLDIQTHDEVIQLRQPLRYRLEVQMLEHSLLAQGQLRLTLDCQCVRCLKRFNYQVELNPWTGHFVLQGEDAVAVVNDCVDLTPAIREDILLEFPQHPLCERDCRGLRSAGVGKSSESPSKRGQPEQGSPAWNELNKLKF